MQYSFQEGLLCGLLMTHDSVSYNPNKNYKPLNDPLFNYILEKYTPKVEIIMTPHYTYKYYHDVTPFYSTDDILLWKDLQHSGFQMRGGKDDPFYGPGNYAQGTKLHNFYKAINSPAVTVFKMQVWYRDGKPIIGRLFSGLDIGTNYVQYHDKYTTVNGHNISSGTVCYPEYAIKDMTITQSAPIGVIEQTYYVSSSMIKKRSITLPEGAVNPSTITVTYNQGTNYCYPSNYDLMQYDPVTGRPLPTNPPEDWSGDPIIFPSSFTQKTSTSRGDSMRKAPDFTISSYGGQFFCEMSPDEFHECELELINQQYEVAGSRIRVYDIPTFLLPEGFTNKDLPSELNKTLPTT